MGFSSLLQNLGRFARPVDQAGGPQPVLVVQQHAHVHKLVIELQCLEDISFRSHEEASVLRTPPSGGGGGGAAMPETRPTPLESSGW